MEHALSQARRELYREVSVLAPDKRIVELFQVKYDYHNAKLALKSKRTGEDVSRLAMDCGRVDAQDVRALADSFVQNTALPTAQEDGQ